MRGKIASGLVLTLLLASMLSLAFNIQPVKAETTTIIVPDDYEKIQWAIGNASDGDSIFVRADIYYEHLTIDKSISLIGENKHTTIIDGGGTGTVVYVTADNVDISGLTMRDSGAEYPWYNGITLRGSNNVINNNILSNNLKGIYLGEPPYSTNNTIVGNIILSNNGTGIHLYYVHNNTIIGNTVSNNGRHGILSHHSANNSIADNVVLNNCFGIGLSDSIGDNILGNTLLNNEIGIGLQYSSSIIYHNNFINNTQQIYDNSWDFPSIPPSISIWDDGYPSGGNYWSDHVTVDANSGINQDELGSDGIIDEPYIIDSYNRDNYPLVEPWNSVERKVGVKIGDWVKYSNFDVDWSSDDPNSEMPVGIVILSEMEWLENSVETILGTKIKYQQLLHFKNGSEIATTCWIDVETASGTPGSFISSGLGQGDCLYDSAPWFAWKINDTISRVYIGVPREVNYLNITTSMHIGPPPAYPNTTGNFYWDKETGVLCELSMKHLNQTGSHVTSWSVFYEIVGTNLWEAPNPAEETQELIETIETWELPKGTENSLTSKLKGALHLLDIENENGATHKLMAFMNQVEALQGKKLTDLQADYLISEAQRIIDLIKG